ncbi:hypothetical protein B0T24DRAFT_641663 [Lasiosphaeria ovina]|uniref:C2H2-type domain-containing protein n=1 Tax=Lasiosphaeria ovina TaxID=92902 RepID=A0AAE0JTW7_9PEZI|nr:hypothetical protein B0T24DRAFT_641663 [Lasiosphaeria ovina]
MYLPVTTGQIGSEPATAGKPSSKLPRMAKSRRLTRLWRTLTKPKPEDHIQKLPGTLKRIAISLRQTLDPNSKTDQQFSDMPEPPPGQHKQKPSGEPEGALSEARVAAMPPGASQTSLDSSTSMEITGQETRQKEKIRLRRKAFKSQHRGIYALQMPSTVSITDDLCPSKKHSQATVDFDVAMCETAAYATFARRMQIPPTLKLKTRSYQSKSIPSVRLSSTPSAARARRLKALSLLPLEDTSSSDEAQASIPVVPPSALSSEEITDHLSMPSSPDGSDARSAVAAPCRPSVDLQSGTNEFPTDSQSSDGCQSSEIGSIFSTEESPLESSVSATSLADLLEPGLNQPSSDASDTEDTMSDVTDHTDPSLIDAFEASPTPFNPVLLSLLVSLREEIVDRIKQRLQAILLHSHGGQERPAQPGNSGSSPPNPPAASTERAPFVNILPNWRKGAPDEDDPDNLGRGNGGDDDRGKPTDATSRTQLEDRLRRFACPFYKMYPKSEGLHKSCQGPGWGSVHRVKEHIYRRHQRPTFHCTRCLVSFANEENLAEHIRGEVRCENRTAPPDEETLFISQSQGQALRKRKKDVPEEERWTTVFQIIFPDVPADHIPSPYHESCQDSLPSSAILSEFCEFLAQQLPSRIAADVNNHLRVHQPPLAPHGIHGDMTEIFRSTVREVINEFLPALQAASPGPGENGSPTSSISARQPLLPDDFHRIMRTPPLREPPPPPVGWGRHPLLGSAAFFDASALDFGFATPNAAPSTITSAMASIDDPSFSPGLGYWTTSCDDSETSDPLLLSFMEDYEGTQLRMA